MNRIGITTLLAVLAAAHAAGAQDKKDDGVKDTVKAIQKAVSASDAAAAQAAFQRAESLKATVQTKQLAPVVKALAGALKAKDKTIAVGAAETLGKMKVPGSGKAVGPFLNVKPKAEAEALALHLACIRAAGAIHDPGSQKPLQKLLGHALTEIATAAAESLSGYRALDSKPRLAFVKQLAGALEGLEKKKAGAKDEKKTEHYAAVEAALLKSIQHIAAKDDLSDAAAVKAWLKDAAKG